jgi:ribonuclease D
LNRSREAITKIATDNNLPAENLLSPATVRSLAWQPPSPVTVAAVTEALLSAGARRWQTELTAAPLAEALAEQ